MTPRYKKLLGTAILLPALAIYFAAAMVIADHVPAVWPLQLGYFVAAGLAWTIPARYLMRWMMSEPPASRN